jgi:serine phosphatase RsbU (regulator of sigma subunit)
MSKAVAERLLVVDDDAKLARLLKGYLEGVGYAVDIALDGIQGLTQATASPYSAVILDLMMPGMSGLEVLRELRKQSSVPVLMFTGLGQEPDRIAGLDVGADDYLPKTISTQELAARIRAVLRRSLLTRQEEQELRDGRQALDEAARIQQALLPKEFPAIPGFDISGAWLPARSVSGDYYNVLRLTDRHFAFCIADVAGKGMPAALLMANLQAAVVAFAKSSASPDVTCRNINQLMAGNVAQGRFITFFYGVVDTSANLLSYCCAGHNPPILVRSDNSVVNLEAGGMVIGLTSDATFESETVPLQPGDRIVLFTDGVTEATAPDGEQFGVKRLLNILKAGRDDNAQVTKDAVISAVSDFSHGIFHDDVTLLVIYAH